ncbi:MAG: prepilin peptidase [Nanoarchaeota archaeon]|nr:prepilin peptidase [Nanoarchaeota archaeon]
MIEVIFLLALAFIWIIFAVVSDLKSTEIPNWLSFSLIIFALVFRFFYSLFSAGDLNFFYQGLIGLGIFFVISNLLYYSRVFAGGDATLMMAMGPILPLSGSFFINIEIFLSFLILFMSAGAIYGIIMSIYFSSRNFNSFKKELLKWRKSYVKFNLAIMSLGVFVMIIGVFTDILLLYLGIIIFAMPLLYVYSRAVEESCMKKEISPKALREGDLLYNDVRVGNKTVKASWEGITEKDMKILAKSRKRIMIKYGIPFAPVFLIGLALLVYFYLINPVLWNSFW